MPFLGHTWTRPVAVETSDNGVAAGQVNVQYISYKNQPAIGVPIDMRGSLHEPKDQSSSVP